MNIERSVDSELREVFKRLSELTEASSIVTLISQNHGGADYGGEKLVRVQAREATSIKLRKCEYV